MKSPHRYSLSGALGRLTGALVLGGLALSGSFQLAPAAAAPTDVISLTSPNNTTIAESDDYATQVLGHPWDMSTREQLGFLVTLAPPTVSNGIWATTNTATGGSFDLVDTGFTTTNPYLGQAIGPNYPIDSHRFSHLRFRMYVASANYAVVWWYNAPSAPPVGNSTIINTQPGWHVYDLDLTATSQSSGGQAWTSQNWTGLRLDTMMTTPAGSPVQLDWVRLTPATGSTANITWTATGTNPISLYLDTDQNSANGTDYTIASGLASGTRSYAWNTAGIAPGTYYVRAVMGGAESYSGPLVVNAAPVLNITAPSPTSGEDFATARLGAPWTLTTPGQVKAWFNLSNIQIGPNYYQAQGNLVSGGHSDPELWMLNNDQAHMIDTSRYHYVSYQMYLQAPNYSSGGQYSQWNIGPRIVWMQPGSGWQEIEPHVQYYNRWENVAYNMRTMQLAPGENNPGWAGNISTLRLDPNEEDGAFGSGINPGVFQVKNLRITADPTVQSGGLTLISWQPVAKQSGYVTLQYSTSPAGGGTTFASNVPMSQGGYYWTPNLPADTYWITALATDGYNSFVQTSKAPLVIAGTHSCPPSYSDAPQGSTFYPYISNLACRNIVEGYNDNTFHPGDPAPRALLTRWVSLTRNWPPSVAGGPHFSDVSPLDPLYTFVETGVAHGIIGGYTDGTFRPYNTVTRAQTAKIIVLAMGWQINTTGGPHFSDVPPSDQFYGYIETLVNHGAVGGYADGTYHPGDTLSRGQLSKILQISSP